MTTPYTKDHVRGMASWLDRCPERSKHTPSPAGYLAWHEWADRKSRRHYQVRCPGCGLFAVWRRKPKGMPDDESPGWS